MRAMLVGLGVLMTLATACSDDDDGGDSTRPADPMLGGGAVGLALDVNLLDDEQFATVCGLYLDNPSQFAETIAAASRPIGGDEIQPTPADVRAWGESAC